ncbi:MAG: RsmE family RNA methyltransferase, partial [Myxococcales bacterium]|nr:RsmE family RNA methyltransferase [Myxococcales bacterium]
DAEHEIWLAIGPEGGFSDTELASFDAAGWRRLSLGPTILRVDTAAVAAVAQLMAAYD